VARWYDDADGDNPGFEMLLLISGKGLLLPLDRRMIVFQTGNHLDTVVPLRAIQSKKGFWDISQYVS